MSGTIMSGLKKSIFKISLSSLIFGYSTLTLSAQYFKFNSTSQISFANTVAIANTKIAADELSPRPLQRLEKVPLISYKYNFDPAIFCRMERRIYNKTAMNLKLNLGSHDYVNYLEGKR